MDIDLLKFALIALMVAVGLGAIFVIVLPIVTLTSMMGGTAANIAGSKKSEQPDRASK